MGQTRTSYLIIDDTEVDAESPVTESLVTRMRDQWYGALCVSPTTAPTAERLLLPERGKTTETDTTLRLAPDGAGGIDWVSGVPDFIGIMAYRNTATSTFSGSGMLDFPDTVVDSHDFLTDNASGPVTTNNRITIPVGFTGVYRITAKLEASTARGTYIEVNGTAFDGTNGGNTYQYINTEQNGVQFWNTFDLNLAEGDYIEVWARGTASAMQWLAGSVLTVAYQGPAS